MANEASRCTSGRLVGVASAAAETSSVAITTANWLAVGGARGGSGKRANAGNVI